MTQPGSIIPPQPGWWVRSDKSGTVTPSYGWETDTGGSIPRVFGAKRTIILPQMASKVYPLLMPLRMAMQGGKIYTRPSVDEHGDPGIGALTSIRIPRPEHPTYPLFPEYRLGMRKIALDSDLVIFDSVGSKAVGVASSWSWTHSFGVNANALIVYVYFEYSSAPGALTVKVGTTVIPQLVSLTVGSSSGITTVIQAYGMLNPPSGAMSAQLASGSVGMTMNSVAYQNVSAFGTPITNSGHSTSLTSGSVTAQSPQLISQMFTLGLSSSDTLSAYNETIRSQITASGGSNYAMIIGDAPGAVGVNFSATGSPSDFWGSIAIPLLTAR